MKDKISKYFTAQWGHIVGKVRQKWERRSARDKYHLLLFFGFLFIMFMGLVRNCGARYNEFERMRPEEPFITPGYDYPAE